MALPSRRFRLGCLLALSLCGLTSAAHAALPAQVVADLRSKAEAGNAIAQYNLGLAYADPAEPIADPAEAFVWLTLAQEKGSNERALAALMERLTPAQLAEGRRRLEARRTTLAQAAAVREASPITPVVAAPSGPVAVAAPAPAAAANPLAAEVAALQEDKKQLSAELAAAWRETEAAKAGSISKVAELNLVIAARDRTIADLQRRLDAVASTPSATGADALRAAESARDQAQRDLLSAAAEIRTANETLQAERTAALDLRRRFEALAAEKVELSTRVAALEADLARKPEPSSEVAALRAALEARDLSLASLRQDLAQRTQALEELERRAATAPVADEGAARQLAETEAKLSAALRSFSVQRDALDTAQASLAALQAEKTALLERVELLQTEAQSSSQEMTRLRAVAAEADARSTELARTREELQSVRATVAQLEPAATETTVLREQLRHAQQQNGALAVEIGQLRTRIAALAPAPGTLLSAPSRPGAVPPVTLAAPPPAAIPSGPASPPAAAAARAPAPRQHVVQTGDTLSKIAARYYGDASRWDEIAEANRDIIANPDRLVVGSSLRIP